MPVAPSALQGSEIQLQRKLQGSGIRLDIRNSSERTTCLLNQIGLPIRAGRQAVVRVWVSEILMVQHIIDFPSELYVDLFGDVEILY